MNTADERPDRRLEEAAMKDLPRNPLLRRLAVIIQEDQDAPAILRDVYDELERVTADRNRAYDALGWAREVDFNRESQDV